MSPDERALLAAVCAAPADDTPRLVYADWLDDAGRVERAEFIRCQVEAELPHPDSHRRAVLEARAEHLFAEHWIDWWAEVCAAVGLPAPERPRQTRLGRLARRVAGKSPGWPYNAVTGRAAGWPHHVARCGVYYQMYRTAREFPPAELGDCGGQFFRGFPGRLAFNRFTLVESARAAGIIRRWAGAVPLGELRLSDLAAADWGRLDGPYLAGLHRLTLHDWGDSIPSALSSSYLGGLTDLQLETTDPPGTTADALATVAASPAAPRLRRLEVPLPDQASAEVLAGAERLSRLSALAVELEFEPDISGGVAGPFPAECDRQRLEALARSPHLAGLTELHVSGVLSAAGVRALVHRPTWARLRTLTLTPLGDQDYVAGLTDCTLSDLSDLRLDDGDLTPAVFGGLARLPLLRQLRHLRVSPPYHTPDADILAVADALDPDRIETVAFGPWARLAIVRPELTRRFGDRVRLA